MSSSAASGGGSGSSSGPPPTPTPTPTPPVESVREKLLGLNAARAVLEEQVDALTLELQANGAGVKGKLVDEEGFPRADVDVYDATHKRARLATLNYDHKAVMKEIETLLPVFYKEQADANPEPEANSSNFNSGVREGDLLLKFADITQQSFEPFKRIAEHVGKSLNVPFELVVNRGGEIVAMTLTPKVWPGRGSLGCHLSPIKR